MIKRPHDTYLIPSWPAPAHIKSYCTTRCHGVSQAPYDSFNLATHVGDCSIAVLQNRQKLKDDLTLPSSVMWLNQTHSNRVIDFHLQPQHHKIYNADASIVSKPNMVSVVMTGDCLPILICSQDGKIAAAIHAGWRGLLTGIIDNTIRLLTQRQPAQNLLVWLGPAIGPQAFQVNPSIRQAFLERFSEYEAGFATQQAAIHADLYTLARITCSRYGITKIYGGQYCTYHQPELFFSHRYSQGKTGRMATLIWITPQ